jgi:hypothetical protein
MKPLTGCFIFFALFVYDLSAQAAPPIYATSGDGANLVTINPANGASTLIGSSGTSGAYAAAFSPDGSTLYGILGWNTSNDRLGKYNVATGTITPVSGNVFGVPAMLALEVSSNGILYGGSWGTTNNFFSINPTTGIATIIGSTGFDSVMDFAFDSQGTLWAVNNFDLWKINTGTGAATHVTAIQGTNNNPVMGIMFDGNDVLYATEYTSSSVLYTINTTTGNATLVGNTGLFYAHGGDIFSVPEPTSFALLGIGMLIVALCRRSNLRRLG